MATGRTIWLRRILTGLLVALIAGPLWPDGAATAQTSPRSVDEELARAIANGGRSPDRVVVVYDQGVARADSRRQRARQQVPAQAVESTEGAINRDIVWVANSQAAQAAATLRQQPGVRDAYPDAVASISKTVNDPYVEDQWALTKMQVPLAWDSSEGDNVKVAVLDCGVHRTHPDLVDQVVLERNFAGTATVDDRCNHGTHVAGTIGARTNNGLGVAGVAPDVDIISGKVLADTGSGFFSDIDAGIRWAADQGARVINLSLNGNLACPAGTQAAVNYAWNEGAVVVAAAGNSGQSSAGAPGNCQNVVAAASTNSNDSRASSSNYGTAVDVAGPGVEIYSTVNPELNDGSAYEYFSGTSMASANVAGVLALIWASDFGTGAQAVVNRLYATADPIAGTGSSWSAGRVNAAKAVGSQQNPSSAVRDLAVTALTGPTTLRRGRTGTISLKVTNQGSVQEQFQVRVVDSTGNQTLKSISVRSLAPSRSMSISFKWKAPSDATLGAHTITATLPTLSGETDTDDNSRSIQITVRQ